MNNYKKLEVNIYLKKYGLHETRFIPIIWIKSKCAWIEMYIFVAI